MKTRHKILNLNEEDEEYFNENLYSNKKRNNKDSDEDYDISKDEDYSSDTEYDDASNIINREIRQNYKSKTNKKTKSKKINKKISNKKNKASNKTILRKSFKNSLGGKNSINIQDNKENINDNLIKSNFKNYTNNIEKTKSKKKSSYIEKHQKKLEINDKKEEEKTVIEKNLDKEYFYEELTTCQWKEISNFISSSLSNKNLSENDIESFFSKYPNLSKGENNITKLRKILEDSTKNNGFFFNLYSNKEFEFNSYQKLNEYIVNKYYMVKPSIFEVHFFPNSSEEICLINLISKTRESLDIAMFTINNIRIAEEIKNIYHKGIKLRIITDGECIKMPSSNIYSLAAIGIDIKIDDSIRYHMHHKFCVIDKSVVITGSFNWTDQAVNHNQENLLFLENKNLAIKYSNEFQKLWDDFEIVVTKEKALLKIKEDEEKKRAIENRKKREKEKKLMEKENKKREINNYDEKSFSKKKRNRREENYEQNDNNKENCSENIIENKGKNCNIF